MGKVSKTDGYLSAIVYSNSDWKNFLTLLKIKYEKGTHHNLSDHKTMNTHMIYFQILL